MATRARYDVAPLVACAVLACAFAAPTARAEDAPGGGPSVTIESPAVGSNTPATEPFEDRWRMELPPYQLNAKGHWWDPYNQNVLKGDIPILGEDIFLKLTGISKTSVEGRGAPSPSGVSTEDPSSFDFFGNRNAILFDQKFVTRFELQKGQTSFKPFEWQIVLEGAYDVNLLATGENGIVDPDVRDATDRLTTHAALQEAFVEIHLADTSVNYDFLSTKIGRQPFNSDFRSLLFSDVNQGIRFFGNANSNRYQYNLAYFYPAEKDTNSDLNTFGLRDQQIAIGNLYIQDFLKLGYTTQFSFHYLNDDGKDAGFVFDNQGFLVRPDPVGVARPHDLDVFYLGWTGEGHLGWVNVSHAFYQALGHDTSNPIAGRDVNIEAQQVFLELSMDRDWMRYQTSVFWSSGDSDPRDDTARGFDTILDNPQIMGGSFSYWQRQSIRVTDRGGVALMQRNSVVPDLRSSKTQGQPNFVNPGILMVNVGATADLTQTVSLIGNATYLRFVDTEPLQLLLKQPDVRQDIGIDLSLGVEYRPFLNNNVIVKGFGAILQPFGGFNDILESNTLYQVGTEVVLVF
ncbi:MAG: hypothetical protein IT293_09730 [Deltaproteobacteria bacterium]|nr:hypothetical protein [Deltaproteobacteria bacterium]